MLRVRTDYYGERAECRPLKVSCDKRGENRVWTANKYASRWILEEIWLLRLTVLREREKARLQR